MWLIAQLFAGTIAAGTGIGVYYLCKSYIVKKYTSKLNLYKE